MTTADIKALWRTLPLAPENDLRCLDRQIELNPQPWEAAGRFLRERELAALPLGRNEIGEGAFANVQEYETKLQSQYELHRRYIDVQLLVRGEELVYVAPKEMGRMPQGDFDEQNDFILYASADNASAVHVSPQRYLILYPSDAHMPCMAIDGTPKPVRKIVVKIPYAV
ncbi:MAG: YhcH/YjgK/YiaL family protein [Bacteroidaceae bacterium]|nr:YhcH/YjgK/YiaL family protein [Bacteroidaceae bacterium]